MMCKSKMHDNNSTKDGMEELEVYCFKALMLYLKCYDTI